MARAHSPVSRYGHERGGRITFTFIMSAIAGLTMAGRGWTANLIVYLIQEFNVPRVDAAQLWNFVNGCTNLFPVLGAVIADSFLGCFSVITISSCVSLLGIVLLALTATIDSLSPKQCDRVSCETRKSIQFAFLYAGIALATLGIGGTRFTLATMGASQIDDPKDQETFFNWYFFTFYSASVVGSTVLVYIEDNVSWRLGFWLCAAANFVGLAVFVSGRVFYRRPPENGSPFADMARVVVAATRKRKVLVSSTMEDYYYGEKSAEETAMIPGKNLRFLNRAAVKTEGDIINLDGSSEKPWKLCTVQQVEDLKILITILPLWSTTTFLGTPIVIQACLTVLQVLAMDRNLSPHFEIPAGSIFVVILISASLSISVIDRFLIPMWHKLIGRNPTLLQRIGVGHMLTAISMTVSALVESKRLERARAPHASSLGALWLFPQLALVGLAEAFYLPGQTALYFQEFPVSLKNTSTAMLALIIGISFYVGTAVIDVIKKSTAWLPNDINQGRIDNVYWILVAMNMLNFGYYLTCAKLYRYRNAEKEEGQFVQKELQGV